MLTAITAVGVYAVLALRGPQGIPALMEKRHEIRELEEQNATLARENQRKKERIDLLKHSPEQQELEIRKQLKLLKPGETSFILPGGGPRSTEASNPEPAAVKPAEAQ
jgi:cell division protein FtsB